MSKNTMRIVPVYQKEANDFVRANHRHHGPVVGSIFQVGVAIDNKIVGVVICGRPLGKNTDNGWTLEVLRNCTDGTPNACSMLYGAAWRVAKGMGYKRIITAISKKETGTSLKAAGWKYSHDTGGRSWNVPSRKRKDKHELGPREYWLCGQDWDDKELEAPCFKKKKQVVTNGLFDSLNVKSP